MHGNHVTPEFDFLAIMAVPLVIALIAYIIAVYLSNFRFMKRWPIHRTVFWVLGLLSLTAAIIGPIADRSHTDFALHMVGHLLLGMLSPLLLALAAPMTLVLRTLPIHLARGLSKFLKSSLVGILSNPVFSTIFNIGGLWILYTTDLFMAMQHQLIIHVLVHLHVFLAGYLFTISLIYIDPTPHRTSHVYRSVMLLIALAAHGILSKYIYAHPPKGVPVQQAEMGGMIMYYGGDAIDLILIFILCFQWYKASRPRLVIGDALT